MGIVNIKKRLRLIYGDQAKILASNEDGAKIEILLPSGSISQGQGDEKQ